MNNPIEDFKQEVKETLDITYRIITIRSTIGLIADENSEIQVTWEKNMISGQVVFFQREDDDVFEGKGMTCREAFANKEKI